MILYVKPQFSEKDNIKLKSEGKKIIYKTDFENTTHKSVKNNPIAIILSAVVGAAVSMSIYLLFLGV